MLLDLDTVTAEYIEGISRSVDRYDAFLLDVWGVLHDAAKPYPGVIDCLQRLKSAGKTIVLLSNAARRSEVLARELRGFGIMPQLYDHIVSSGELVWRTFAEGRDERLKKLGRKYVLLGPERYNLTVGLDLERVEGVEDADFLLAIGVFGNPASTEAEEPVLAAAAEKGLPMLCANPDLRVVRNGVMGIAVGAVAARYEELGGEVTYFGKPYPAIYERCFEVLAAVPRSRIVAVGDGLITDIAGAGSSGLDTILVAGGIHAEELRTMPADSSGLAALCRKTGHYPSLVVKGFYW